MALRLINAMPDDNEVQEAILEVLCDEFHDQPGLTNITVSSLIDVLESDGYADNEVQYNLDRLDDQFAVDHQGAIGGNGTVKLTYRGITEYENLSDDTVIPGGPQTEVLEELDSEQRSNPQSGNLSREDLLDNTSLSEKQLDKVVWFMKEAGQIDALTHTGTPWWSSASITESGRRILERRQ